MVCARHAKGMDKPQRVGSVTKLSFESPPDIRLRYGQVLWLLTQLGHGTGVRRDTLHEYVRAQRKLGIPFGTLKFQTKRGRRLAVYSYPHLMEVALVFTLRVYHVIPTLLLRKVIDYRRQLNRLYRQAYEQRGSGLGELLVIKRKNRRPIELRGLFLDLNIKFSGGRLARFGPPKLLSSGEALERFGKSTGQTFPPINLSLLAERVVSLASTAPTIRSGPRPVAKRPLGHSSRQNGR
jgi:hypothetical protein